MQVGDVVEPVEGPVVDVLARRRGHGDRLVGQQVQVDPRPQLADPRSALRPVACPVGGDLDLLDTEEPGHDRQVLAGPERDVVPHDGRLDLAIEGDGRDGVLDAGDHQDLILDLVGVAAQPAERPSQALRRGHRRVISEQHRVELPLRRPGGQFLLLQRHRRVEQRGPVAVFFEQPDRQRGLLRQAAGVKIVKVPPQHREVARTRVQPEPLVGREPASRRRTQAVSLVTSSPARWTPARCRVASSS